jgi:hypothetical protein
MKLRYIMNNLPSFLLVIFQAKSVGYLIYSGQLLKNHIEFLGHVKWQVMFEFATNPPPKQYISFFLVSSNRSVNREIIYIPNSLISPVLILFSTIYVGRDGLVVPTWLALCWIAQGSGFES